MSVDRNADTIFKIGQKLEKLTPGDVMQQLFVHLIIWLFVYIYRNIRDRIPTEKYMMPWKH